MKVCVISSNAGSNAFGRAWILAKAIQANHEVSIVGTDWGKGIWNIADISDMEVKLIQGGSFPGYWKTFNDTVDLVEGDIILAVKPKLSSFGIGLKARRKLKIPLILDIDDDETAFTETVWNSWKPNSLKNPNAYLSTKLMESQVSKADVLTVISEHFIHRFGRGTIIPHGRDTDIFDPDKYVGEVEKKSRSYEHLKLCVFLGTPRRHKGIGKVLTSISRSGRKDFKLLIVGANSRPSSRARANGSPWSAEMKCRPITSRGAHREGTPIRPAATIGANTGDGASCSPTGPCRTSTTRLTASHAPPAFSTSTS